LLGLITLNLIFTAFVYPTPQFVLPAILSILVFGAIGLKTPIENTFNKIIFTALEFIIILAPNLLDSRIPPVPLLGLIAVIRSCQMFRLLGRFVVATLTFLAFLYVVLFRSQFVIAACRSLGTVRPQFEQILSNPVNFQLGSAVSFGLTVIFAFPLMVALLSERQSRARLAIAHRQLRQYALLIEDQATLQERNRIAREIHDALGHTLTAQSIQLENALLFLPIDRSRAEIFLAAAKQLGATALQEVRQSITALRANPLEDQSLETAIDQLVQEFHQTTGVSPACSISLTQSLPLDSSTAVYRILQEALTNIYKHSGATQVTIRLDERNAIYLNVTDNGKGFDPACNTTGFGLQGMHERAVALGGQFALISQPGAGCQIFVTLPLPKLPR